MPFARINGFDMHYEVQGTGPPLVMAHGLLSSIAMAEMMGEVPPPLLDEFTIIRYDSRGHGESGYTTEVTDYMWDSLAEDLHQLFLHLGLKSAYLSGSSMGGGSAIVFTLRHPEMVRKLVLQSPPPIGQRESSYGAALFGGFALLVEGLGLKEAADLALRLKPWCDIRESAPPIFEWIQGWLLSLKEEALVPAIRGVVHGPALSNEAFARIGVPTLLVAHPGDEIHPLESAQLLSQMIPDSRLVVVPDGLYYMLHRDELGQVIKDFLRG
jgi:pimeloyl-ACP methyl ester carboxylesterase